jgi:Protein of unknown function (DUF1077)
VFCIIILFFVSHCHVISTLLSSPYEPYFSRLFDVGIVSEVTFVSVHWAFCLISSFARWRNLAPPPGFEKATSSVVSIAEYHMSQATKDFSLHQSKVKKPRATAASYDSLKEKRAWDAAIAPAKALPMQAFMLYMSGGGVQIFSIGIVFMLLLSPFKNIAGINEGTLFFSFFEKLCSSNILFCALFQLLLSLHLRRPKTQSQY